MDITGRRSLVRTRDMGTTLEIIREGEEEIRLLKRKVSIGLSSGTYARGWSGMAPTAGVLDAEKVLQGRRGLSG